MSPFLQLLEHRVEVPRDALAAYVRAQLGGGLRRAGVSAEFTLAGAREAWGRLDPAPAAPSLALIWSSRTFAGTENAACLAELREGALPMPFQFIASQPHMAAVHAQGLFPGLAQATTLAGAGMEEDLLEGLALGKPWTHVLLGEVWTPAPWQEGGDRFRAVWRVLGYCP